MMPRIAITGLAGTGKTTIADAISAHFKVPKLSIARPVKRLGEAVARRLGIDPADKVAVRPIFDAIGTEGRTIDPRIWINMLALLLGDADDQQGFTVDDVRYANEAELLKAHGFLVLRVECDEETRRWRMEQRDGTFDPASLTNASELSVADVPHDALIQNGRDRTLDSLVQEVLALAEQRFIRDPADRVVA